MPGAKSAPNRIVNWFSDAPNTTATSACATSSIAASAPNPPVTPRSNSGRGKMPRPRAVEAVSAPVASARAPSASPAPAIHAPRPASRNGRFAPASAAAASRIAWAANGAARRDRLGQTGLGRFGHGPRLERGDVVGDREHGRHAIGQRVLDRDDGRRRGIRSAHRVGACADRRGESDLVDAPGAAARCRLVADDEHEGHVRLHRLGQRGQRVREAGAVGGGRGGEPAARAVIGVGGDDAAGLVAHGGVADVGGALEGIEEVGVAVAHHPEDVVDVAGEGRGDVRGNGGHGVLQRQGRTDGIRMCLAAPFGAAACPFSEHRRDGAGRGEFTVARVASHQRLRGVRGRT